MTEEAPIWEVIYTNPALEFIDKNVRSEKALNKIFKYRELLSRFPDFGQVYNPSYPASELPFLCRHISIPVTNFVLYYFLDETKHAVVIFYLDFQTANPSTRFSGIEYSLIPWISD